MQDRHGALAMVGTHLIIHHGTAAIMAMVAIPTIIHTMVTAITVTRVITDHTDWVTVMVSTMDTMVATTDTDMAPDMAPVTTVQIPGIIHTDISLTGRVTRYVLLPPPPPASGRQAPQPVLAAGSIQPRTILNVPVASPVMAVPLTGKLKVATPVPM